MNSMIIRGSNFFFNDRNPDKSEAILLVHGHPFDHSMWNYQLNSLQGFRLILPDLRGYGKSDFDFDKIYIEEQALDLAILLDQLDIENVHLIGLSMGGQIIVEFCRLFPHRTKSLIICDSNPVGESEKSYQNRLDLAEKINKIGMEEYTKQDIDKYISEFTISHNQVAYEHLFKMMTSTKKEGAVASHKGRVERRDNFGYLRSIKCPTLFIVGEDDFFTPVQEMENVAEQVDNARFEIVKNAGHLPNMEQAEVFNTIMETFYNNITHKS